MFKVDNKNTRTTSMMSLSKQMLVGLFLEDLVDVNWFKPFLSIYMCLLRPVYTQENFVVWHFCIH